jgi:3'-phosphoadenosine 5'-phosphosulfate sulfotransferase (PAPS reductase)/FAD synthetase
MQLDYSHITGLYKPAVHIVSLSSGCASAVAAERVLNDPACENVQLVFADTKWEDDDNYRFLDDLEKRWGVPIMRLQDGRNPLQVFEDEHVIPNDFLAPCTHRLKTDLIRDYVDNWRDTHTVFMVIGFDHKDARPRPKKPRGRLPGAIKNWSKHGVLCMFPLLDKPIAWDTEATVKSWGIQPPRMYAQGYSHANCGGRCVKQGQSDWRRTLVHYPERFREVEQWEAQMRENEVNAPYTILTRQVDGDYVNYPLSQLREDVEKMNERQLRLFDFEDDLQGKSCGTECGVGGYEDAA